MKIRDILKNALGQLIERKNALLDCELILANVLGEGREYLLANSEKNISDDLIKLFETYLLRIKAGEPVAYILKQKEFYGLDFYVDNRVLIPRPETEFLVDTVLGYLRKRAVDRAKVLDVGTGSCNISVSLAVNFSNLDITALDISEEALDVARINVEQHGVEDKVELCQSDLLDVVDKDESFDVIVANLPYIGTIENNGVEKNVKEYEPAQALFAGSRGLKLYKKMFRQIRDKNVRYGMIVGEIGSMQRQDMELLLNKYFEQNWKIEKDLARNDRMFVIEKYE